MLLTLDVPDELAAYLPSKDSDLAAVLSEGLRHRRSSLRGEIRELDDIIDLLAQLPSPDKVLAMRPSEQFSERTRVLLDKSKNEGLDLDEQAEWQKIMRVEHLVRVAKARALKILKTPEPAK
jgi:hypothetical protein